MLRALPLLFLLTSSACQATEAALASTTVGYTQYEGQAGDDWSVENEGSSVSLTMQPAQHWANASLAQAIADANREDRYEALLHANSSALTIEHIEPTPVPEEWWVTLLQILIPLLLLLVGGDKVHKAYKAKKEKEDNGPH